MTLKVAINGFGRIGRNVLRALYENGYRNRVQVVAINDLGAPALNAHLLRHDTVHGHFPFAVEHDEESLTVDGDRIAILSERDPAALPWASLGVDLVMECTGLFTKRDAAARHLDAGAGRVLISAPSADADATIVFGVNEGMLKSEHKVVSNASCTTNCLAPVAKALNDSVGIENGLMTTVHSYTATQKTVDGPSKKDWKGGRSAGINIIPSTTGAAKAITRIFPELDGRLGGGGIRVPVPDGSITDITCRVKKLHSAEEINTRFKEAAEGRLKGILRYTEDPIVSVDIVGDPHSCILDGLLTSVVGNMVKVMGWYDNEYGYSNRLVDLVGRMAKR